MMIYELITNLTTTLLGVVIGGFIAIKSSNVTNSKLLRKEHTLELLQKVKVLLNSWGQHLLLDGTDIIECGLVSNVKGYTLCAELTSAIAYFNTNISVLKKFQPEFEVLRKDDIKVQIDASALQRQLTALAEKYNVKKIDKLYEYQEAEQAIEAYVKKLFGLYDRINKLVVNIDTYIDGELLK